MHNHSSKILIKLENKMKRYLLTVISRRKCVVLSALIVFGICNSFNTSPSLRLRIVTRLKLPPITNKTKKYYKNP